MASLYGNTWSRGEILRRVGHMDQVAGIKLLEAGDGRERGIRILQVWTGTGLCFQVLADRGLDISACWYKGIPLAWSSSVGDVHPAYYEPQGLGWLRSFRGGLLVTCGLDHFGMPYQDAYEEFGLHGRVSNLPAQCVSYRAYWVEDDYELEISGEVRQTRVFGENLVLQRRITTRLGSNYIRIEDTVTNEGMAPNSHMLLYHFNLGFPLVSEKSQLHLEAHKTVPRNEDAAAGMADWKSLQPPTVGYREQVFLHTPVADAEGKVRVEVQNPSLGVGLRFSYNNSSLPYLVQWKMMGEGAYVLGIEPANCSGILGRAIAQQSGDLPYLAPGESRQYRIDLEVME